MEFMRLERTNIARGRAAGKGGNENSVIWELSSHSFTFRDMREKKFSICCVFFQSNGRSHILALKRVSLWLKMPVPHFIASKGYNSWKSGWCGIILMRVNETPPPRKFKYQIDHQYCN